MKKKIHIILEKIRNILFFFMLVLFVAGIIIKKIWLWELSLACALGAAIISAILF